MSTQFITPSEYYRSGLNSIRFDIRDSDTGITGITGIRDFKFATYYVVFAEIASSCLCRISGKR